MPLRNPFRDPARRPDWAQLARLGSDRVAILFEELRSQVANIDGLIEDLHYASPETGWTPRYRVGDSTLFRTHIFPGVLEAGIEPNALACEEALASAETGGEFKAAIRQAHRDGESARVRVRLSTRADVRAFAREERRQAKIVARLFSRLAQGH